MMKNYRSDAMQGMWKNQLSHEFEQNYYPEIGIEKVLQTRQEKNYSRIERKTEIIFLFQLLTTALRGKI